MKRLLQINLLLSGLLLLSCCSSPKISDIKVEILDHAPQNYQYVAKAEIEISTRTPISGDVLNQPFDDLKIRYYDKDNNLITTELTKTIQEAVNQNKTNMTLVRNDGRGTNISYIAHLDKDTSTPRTYNAPYVTEVSTKTKTKTEAELKDQAERNKEDSMFKWDGVSSKTIDSIKIRYKQDIEDRDYQYTYDAFSGEYKWK